MLILCRYPNSMQSNPVDFEKHYVKYARIEGFCDSYFPIMSISQRFGHYTEKYGSDKTRIPCSS